MPLKEKLLAKLKPGSFLRSVVTIASGTVIAQIIAVLVSPLITRLFTPEDMGVLASFTAIVAVLGTIAAGRYELAIVLPETDKESNAVAFAGVIFSFIFSFVLTIIAIVFYKPLTSVLKLQGMAGTWFYLIGFFVLLTGFELVLNRTAIRNAHFKVIATTQITQQISTNSIKIAFGFLHPSTIGLFFATLFGQFARIVRLSIGEFKTIFSKENRPSLADIKYAFKRYKKFPLVSSWSGFLNSASTQLPVVLFTAFFSPAVAGFYSLSHRILNLPMGLIGNSVANVFLERAAKVKDNDKELARITLELNKKLLLIGSFILSFVVFYGDILFPFVFGSNWKEAGEYSRCLSLWLIFVLGASPLSSIYTVKERQFESLIFNIVLFLSRLLAIYLPYKYIGNAGSSVKIFALTGMVLWMFWTTRILNLASVPFWKAFLNTIIYPLMILIPQGLISIGVRSFL